MFDAIRRRLPKPVDRDAWSADLELRPEIEEASELLTDTAVLLASTQTAPESTTNDVNSADYYKNLVKTAIENGGKYGDREIPLPWLRMILAGLEMRHIELETMWYGMEESGPGATHLPGIPSNDDLFPSDGDLTAGPGPK